MCALCWAQLDSTRLHFACQSDYLSFPSSSIRIVFLIHTDPTAPLLSVFGGRRLRRRRRRRSFFQTQTIFLNKRDLLPFSHVITSSLFICIPYNHSMSNVFSFGLRYIEKRARGYAHVSRAAFSLASSIGKQALSSR